LVPTNRLLAFPRWVKAAAAAIHLLESQEWEPIRASQLPREENDRCTQSNSVGRSGGKPHDKLVGNGADSDDNFIPATSTAQATTIISHDSPTNFIVQPYNAAALSDCRSVLEEVM
jgi:hypothetical protein